MMSDDVITGCDDCEPLVRLQAEQLGPNHVSVDLHDYTASVFLTGQQVINCAEVVTGLGGWVIGYGEKIHKCPCGSDMPMKTRWSSDGYSVRDVATIAVEDA